MWGNGTRNDDESETFILTSARYLSFDFENRLNYNSRKETPNTESRGPYGTSVPTELYMMSVLRNPPARIMKRWNGDDIGLLLPSPRINMFSVR